MVYDKSWSQAMNLQAVDGTATDAFGRLRVSTPQTIFDSKQIYDGQDLFWSQAVTSGAGSTAYNANRASTSLILSNQTGTIKRQTKRWFNYQPGKSQLIFITFTLGDLVAGCTKRVGYFNDNDGIFLELNPNGLCFVIRSNVTGTPVENRVYQSAWNNDKLDGGGDSRVTLDTTKSQILVIDTQWLGVGRVRCGFEIDGVLVLAHKFTHANIKTGVYMSTPNLPVRYEISSTTNVTASLECICCCVISEGGQDETGNLYSLDREITPLTTLANTSIYPLLAIKLKDGYFGAKLVPSDIHILCTSNSNFRWGLFYNPTFSGSPLVWNDTTGGSVQFANTMTNGVTITGGYKINIGYDAQGTDAKPVEHSVKTRLLLGSTVTGVSDILVLAVQKLSAVGTEDFYASMDVVDVV